MTNFDQIQIKQKLQFVKARLEFILKNYFKIKNLPGIKVHHLGYAFEAKNKK